MNTDEQNTIEYNNRKSTGYDRVKVYSQMIESWVIKLIVI